MRKLALGAKCQFCPASSYLIRYLWRENGRRQQKRDETVKLPQIENKKQSSAKKEARSSQQKGQWQGNGIILMVTYQESDAFNNTDNSNCSLPMDRPIQKCITWLWRTGTSATTPSDAGIIHTSTCNTSSYSTS